MTLRTSRAPRTSLRTFAAAGPRARFVAPGPRARLAAMVLLLGLAAIPSFAAEDAAPQIQITPLEVEATAELLWSFDITLVNPGGSGLYSDSLFCRLEDTGPGATRASRVRILPMHVLAQGFGTLSGGESSRHQYTVPAAFETGTFSIELFCHRGSGEVVTVRSPVVKLMPGPLSKEHPSEFLTVNGRKVEVVLFASLKEGPSPGVLFVHDEDSHARLMMATGLQLSARGYTAVFVSMPGYGLSEGPADSTGPHTAAALGAALDRLKRVPGVDATRLAGWGVSGGAGALANLAAKRTDLSALVAQSGRYDLRNAGKVRVATLVLHGAADTTAPAEQAQAFAAALEKSGTAVESRLVPGAGHALSRSDVQRAALPFLEARLKR